MKKGWVKSKFGDVCQYRKDNGVHKNLQYVGMEHIGQGNGLLLGTIDSNSVLSTSFRFQKGDVLYGRLRPYLKKACVAEFEGCCSTEIFPIFSEHIDASFLKYWLLTDKTTTAINNTCSGCRMPRGNMNEVLNFDFYYPPISKQKEIVEYLDSSFAKIDKLKENAAKNLEEAKALFQSALKDALEPKEGWEEESLGNLYDVRDGTHDSPQYQNDGFPLITSKNLKGEYIDFENVKYISEADYNKINERSKVDIGDVLFAMIGTIGNATIVEKKPNYAIKNMALFKVPNTQSSKMLKYLLDSNKILNNMKAKSNGTTQKFVSLGFLRKYKVSLPSLQEQQSIVSFLDSLNEKVNTLQQNYSRICNECDALKQAILRQVFE